MARLQWLKKKTRRDSPTIHNTDDTSSTHGSGAMDVGWLASGPLTCQQRVEVDLRTDQTSYRAAVPSGVSSCIYMVLEMRDGDMSKLRDKGILKAVLNIVDVIAHKLLGMAVWEQAAVDIPGSAHSSAEGFQSSHS